MRKVSFLLALSLAFFLLIHFPVAFAYVENDVNSASTELVVEGTKPSEETSPDSSEPEEKVKPKASDDAKEKDSEEPEKKQTTPKTQDAASNTDKEKESKESPVPEPILTPDGDANIVDEVSTTDGKEFYVIQTENGNYFYMILDKERQDDNVYLLSAVDEADLKDFLETEEPEEIPEVIVPEAEPDKPDEPEPQESKNDNSSLLPVLLLAAAAGGAAYYFKIYKPKQSGEKQPDLDGMEFEDDETEVNEDVLDSRSNLYMEGYATNDETDE